MILVFNSLQQALDCDEQISSLTRDIYVDRGHKKVGDEIEIKAGKQRIVRWDTPRKSAITNKWWIASPSAEFAEAYDTLVNGHTFEVLDNIPDGWVEEVV